MVPDKLNTHLLPKTVDPASLPPTVASNLQQRKKGVPLFAIKAVKKKKKVCSAARPCDITAHQW